MYQAYCDGYSHRPNGLACVACRILIDSQLIYRDRKKIGRASIHAAEYLAILMALEQLRGIGAKSATIYSDDALVINQINRVWQTEDLKLQGLLQSVQKQIDHFQTVEFQWIPEAENHDMASYSKEIFISNPNTFDGEIIRESPFLYTVVGSRSYQVDLVLSTCTCPAYQRKITIPCKHIIAVRERYGEYDDIVGDQM